MKNFSFVTIKMLPLINIKEVVNCSLPTWLEKGSSAFLVPFLLQLSRSDGEGSLHIERICNVDQQFDFDL